MLGVPGAVIAMVVAVFPFRHLIVMTDFTGAAEEGEEEGRLAAEAAVGVQIGSYTRIPVDSLISPSDTG